MSTSGCSGGPAQRVLVFSTFLCGVCTMAIEMSASRLLAPSFGTSLAVWTNIIGVMMAALCAGYWIGGLVADRYPTRRTFGATILLAGVLAALIPTVGRAALDLTSRTWLLEEFPGSFVATSLIFAPPVFLLGMVNPFAIRLATTDIELSGTLAGRIYTVSTVGSLIGTFLPVLLTIPLLGTLRTVYLFAVLLLVTAIPSIRGQ